MKFFNRVVLPIYGWIGVICTLLVMCFVGLYMLNVVDVGILNDGIDFIFNDRNILIGILVASFIIFLIHVRMIFTDSKTPKTREPLIINSEHGKVAIELETFENVVNLVLKKTSNVTDYEVIAKKTGNDDIEMLVKVAITADANIASVVEHIQNTGMEEIEKMTGVKVKNIHIKVLNVSNQKSGNTKKETPEKVEKSEKKETNKESNKEV